MLPQLRRTALGSPSTGALDSAAQELAFDPPVEVELRGRAGHYGRVRFFADDPRAAVRVLRERVVSARR